VVVEVSDVGIVSLHWRLRVYTLRIGAVSVLPAAWSVISLLIDVSL
jgi:hypothetical protein